MPRFRVKIQPSNTTEAITYPVYIERRIPAAVSILPVFIRVEGSIPSPKKTYFACGVKRLHKIWVNGDMKRSSRATGSAV